MTSVIVMLTRADRTVADAHERAAEALAAGATHLGVKDLGLPLTALRPIAAAVKRAGATLYLEMVSLDPGGEAAASRAAVDLGVDVLMGGTHPAVVLPIISGAAIRYYPFPGEVAGHPSVLRGSAPTIVASARRLAGLEGVAGLDLLAYRFAGNAPGLIGEVCGAAAPKPVVVAGSLDRVERIAWAVQAGAAGVTVGTAALEGAFPAASKRLADQVGFLLREVARMATNHNLEERKHPPT